MRRPKPFPAEATASYALGEVWSRPGLDYRTRQLAAVTAFAALETAQTLCALFAERRKPEQRPWSREAAIDT